MIDGMSSLGSLFSGYTASRGFRVADRYLYRCCDTMDSRNCSSVAAIAAPCRHVTYFRVAMIKNVQVIVFQRKNPDMSCLLLLT